MENISKNITYAEAIHSNTAKRKGIDNTPNIKQVETMKLTAEKIFEPLREFVGGPIKVNSFFRSPELNEAIGGSKTSQHCKGQAIDICRAPAGALQISYVSEEDNRNRCLKAYKDEYNKTKYKVI